MRKFATMLVSWFINFLFVVTQLIIVEETFNLHKKMFTLFRHRKIVRDFCCFNLFKFDNKCIKLVVWRSKNLWTFYTRILWLKGQTKMFGRILFKKSLKIKLEWNRKNQNISVSTRFWINLIKKLFWPAEMHEILTHKCWLMVKKKKRWMYFIVCFFLNVLWHFYLHDPEVLINFFSSTISLRHLSKGFSKNLDKFGRRDIGWHDETYSRYFPGSSDIIVCARFHRFEMYSLRKIILCMCVRWMPFFFYVFYQSPVFFSLSLSYHLLLWRLLTK